MTSDKRNGPTGSSPLRVLNLHTGKVKGQQEAQADASQTTTSNTVAITSVEQLSRFAESLAAFDKQATTSKKTPAANTISSLAAFGTSASMAVKKRSDDDLSDAQDDKASPPTVAVVQPFIKSPAKKPT